MDRSLRRPCEVKEGGVHRFGDQTNFNWDIGSAT